MEQTNQMKDSLSDKRIAMRVSVISIIINVVLSLFKLLAGIFAQSGAMISDAIHSASDVFSTFIVMIGVNISNKKSDTQHQYGHERFECVASIILAVILAITGIGIGISGIEKIFSGNYEELQIPGVLALVAAVMSIIVKEWMYWFTRAAAKKINSGALMADAWHHRSDALSSVGAFIGIFGARLGYPILDPIASVVICLFIEKASYDIFKDAIDKMIDKSCDTKTISDIKQIIAEQEGVESIDEVRTRLFGAKIYVDVEISADGSKSLNETHNIAQNVHDEIENKIPMVKHCMVHVNPTLVK
ncbi:cation diffusion facilitator family transporter [Lachnotalea glycerini]|uniref:Cation diffusion facilitator family transporter n=1 Tax=Lachnotalea glycerini TaxID=1763509 RepID=A0A318EPM0_9FIRM|nr:cation diffusion facilitator family transporter [Lachnotalea glycerini]PXV91524.1 cation diffusion facilitator family transporter [Lachnotalea glycerini]